MMYKVLIKDQEIIVTKEDIANLDVSFDKTKGVYQILKDGISHHISHLEQSDGGKTQILQVNDLNIQATILNPLDQQVESMGLSDIDDQKSKSIHAPMPGLILDIMCKEGEEIEEGNSLLILEAMKMENVIKAEGAGTIFKIHKAVGETVEKGQLIIEIV
jgi:biotin carboxyl carrier protein